MLSRNEILALSHDISSEARDASGKWTGGGSKSSGQLSKKKKEKLEKKVSDSGSKSEKKPSNNKNVVRALVAGAASAYVGLGVKQHFESKTHSKIKSKMLGAIANDYSKVTGQKTSAFQVAQTASKLHAEYAKQGKKTPEHVAKALKQLHYYNKFNTGTNRYKNQVVKALKSHYGIKTFSEHVKHIVSKAITKFKPLRVVKIAGLLK